MTIDLSRRHFLLGAGAVALVAAPAIVRPGILMRIFPPRAEEVLLEVFDGFGLAAKVYVPKNTIPEIGGPAGIGSLRFAGEVNQHWLLIPRFENISGYRFAGPTRHRRQVFWRSGAPEIEYTRVEEDTRYAQAQRPNSERLSPRLMEILRQQDAEKMARYRAGPWGAAT